MIGNTDRIYFDGSDGHIYVVNAEIAENAHVSGTFTVDGNAVFSSNVDVTENYTSAAGNMTLTKGMLNVGGDVTFGANLGVFGDYTSAAGAITLTNGALTVGGIAHILNVTESTGTGSGALVVDGGLGIAKNLYVGGLFAVNNVDINGGTIDALQLARTQPQQVISQH